MNILAHRGLWEERQDRNTLSACRAALHGGFGLEIDVRDRGGEVVVAHDVDESSAWPVGPLLTELPRFEGAWAAINVKSCGLQTLLAPLRSLRTPWFVFDMAVPDLLDYLHGGFRVFTRQSEYETVPACWDESCGVWLDAFRHDWVTADVILGHLSAGKHVCVVSSELHGRPPEPLWDQVRAASQRVEPRPGLGSLLLCTDHPAKARDWFRVA